MFALLISHHRRVHTQEVSVSESCLQQKHEKEPLTCRVEVAKTFSSPANSSGRDFSCAPKRAHLLSVNKLHRQAGRCARCKSTGSSFLHFDANQGRWFTRVSHCSSLNNMTLPLNKQTSLTFCSSTTPLLFLLSLFSSCLHCAPECNYPIYMQNDASDVFVTEPHKDAELGDKDGRERGGRMERGGGRGGRVGDGSRENAERGCGNE